MAPRAVTGLGESPIFAQSNWTHTLANLATTTKSLSKLAPFFQESPHASVETCFAGDGHLTLT